MAEARHRRSRHRRDRSGSWTNLAKGAALPIGGAVLVTFAAGAAAVSEPQESLAVAAVSANPLESYTVSRDYVRTAEGLAAEPRIERPEAEKVGVRYTTAKVAVRTAPNDDAEAVTTFGFGTEVAITGVTYEGYSQILNKGHERWVRTEHLSEDRPFGTAPCPRGGDVERGLKPDAIKTFRAVCAAFPQITRYGGLAPRNDHAKGQAVDIMVTGALGDEIAQFLIDNHRELGVHYIIWKQRYWSVRNPSWKPMADRGSKTANHYDHVHVSTFVNSATSG